MAQESSTMAAAKQPESHLVGAAEGGDQVEGFTSKPRYS